MAVLTESAVSPRDISLHDWSRVADVSPDGKTILFDESGAAAGAEYQVYIRRLPDGLPVRLAAGRAMAFSPDMQHALTLGTGERTRFRIVPLGEGPVTEVGINKLEYQWARYLPDGRRFLALANEPGQPLRLFVVAMSGEAYPITAPVVVRNVAVSPDGQFVALLGADGKMLIYPVARAGTPRHVPTSEVLAPILWNEDHTIFVQHVGAYKQIPTRISRIDLRTGRLEPWQELRPSDPVGINAITKVMMSQNAQTVVFNYRRVFSELFIATRALAGKQ
jgi:hypothetical protein